MCAGWASSWVSSKSFLLKSRREHKLNILYQDDSILNAFNISSLYHELMMVQYSVEWDAINLFPPMLFFSDCNRSSANEYIMTYYDLIEYIQTCNLTSLWWNINVDLAVYLDLPSRTESKTFSSKVINIKHTITSIILPSLWSKFHR